MIGQICVFFASIAVILWGANILTDGASRLAKGLGVSSLVVGLTVVAFGTSAPELVVSFSSALKGSSGIALGNVIGSNIFNNLVVVGLTAMIMPLAIQKSTMKIEIPFLIFASALLSFICLDDQLSRLDGLILFAIFILFLIYNIKLAKRNKSEVLKEEAKEEYTTLFKDLFLILLGLALLIVGGDKFVSSSVYLANLLGVSETVIGLTVVALGTSLPELATSVVAALKGEPELSVGNAVGSGIFNVLCILGITSIVRPIEIAHLGISFLDYGLLIASAVLLFIFSLFWGERKINRVEGLILLVVFVIYMYFLIFTN